MLVAFYNFELAFICLVCLLTKQRLTSSCNTPSFCAPECHKVCSWPGMWCWFCVWQEPSIRRWGLSHWQTLLPKCGSLWPRDAAVGGGTNWAVNQGKHFSLLTFHPKPQTIHLLIQDRVIAEWCWSNFMSCRVLTRLPQCWVLTWCLLQMEISG